jgi:hypothetical protein
LIDPGVKEIGMEGFDLLAFSEAIPCDPIDLGHFSRQSLGVKNKDVN